MKDLLGTAISDHYFGNSPGKLWVHDNMGPRVEMDVSVYFRDWEKMPELERIALQECGSIVLDVGAGAGSHALELQERGKDVTALDISPLNVEVMKSRGVRNAVAEDIFSYSKGQYDTLLLLMNGIGLVGNEEGLRRFLRHADELLLPGGKLLFDSSDVAYMYEEIPMPTEHYYGEIRCRYAYKRRRTDEFSWLYVDFGTIRKLAEEEGWKAELLFEDDDDQYLARLTRK